MWFIQLNISQFATPKLIELLYKVLSRFVYSRSQTILIMLTCLQYKHVFLDRKHMLALKYNTWGLLEIKRSTKQVDFNKSLQKEYWMLAYWLASHNYLGLNKDLLSGIYRDMYDYGVKFFDCEYRLMREQVLFGSSPRGWGGFKDYDLNERYKPQSR